MHYIDSTILLVLIAFLLGIAIGYVFLRVNQSKSIIDKYREHLIEKEGPIAGVPGKTFDIDTLLHGLEKFENQFWSPPAKWTASDRVAFILRFLNMEKKPRTTTEIAKAASRAGDSVRGAHVFNWWLNILAKEGMVFRSTKEGHSRPYFWELTANRRPISSEIEKKGSPLITVPWKEVKR